MQSNRWSVIRILLLISVPVSSLIIHTSMGILAEDKYYPLWSYALFALKDPAKISRMMIRIYKINEQEYPDGPDLFKVRPTVDFFNLSPSTVIERLGQAIIHNNQADLEASKSALERLVLSKIGKVEYSVSICEFNSLKMYKTGECDTLKEIQRFNYQGKSR